MTASLLSTETRIVAKQLAVHYGDVPALRVDSLETQGRIIAVIGHNGSGKSTLMKSSLELLTPRHGSLRIYQQNPEGKEELLIPEKHMAFSPETGAVFADMSVEDYVRLWCRIKHRDPDYFRKGGVAYAERMELFPLLKKLGRELSKGQRRRVQTAVGFLCHPRLFLFDEPFDGLDIQQSNTLAELMREESLHMAMMISSHRMELVERLADLVLVLSKGQIVAQGSVESVCHQLCEQTIAITAQEITGQLIDQLAQELVARFHSSTISRVGGQLILSGNDFDRDQVSGFLLSRSVLHSLEYIRPTLIDAMNYHMKIANN